MGNRASPWRENLSGNRNRPIPSKRFAIKRALIRAIFISASMLIAYQVFASAGDWRIAGNKQSSNGPACAGLEQEILQGGPGPKITLGKEKATLLMLVRNRELKEALGSMRQVEDRFNRRFRYQWTFMNDLPFSADFIKYATGMASGPVEFVQIPKKHWDVPNDLNKTLMVDGMQKLVDANIIYGRSISYRKMCRFNSGFFYEQEVLNKFDWYWRVEPGIEISCDVNYDPFTFMRESGKVYGWVISMYDFVLTIPTLFDETKAFVAANPDLIANDNSLGWIVDGANGTQAREQGVVKGEYNLCHFWSNFEIASLDFYRSDTYRRYFDHLDKTGGFFYERWGDAPVHTLALALFLPRQKIHHFADFGYSHSPAMRCPQDDESHSSGRCYCERKHNFDLDAYSCAPRWFKANGFGKGVTYPRQRGNGY